ncbi:hypothetical protein LSTR_LSTR008340 [Laodelphax striatellus]|uniref:RING-type domain-containing protein n=1 Tax=Laodelphax striatellus TaxID=195883 RepID=A0A482XJD8_LAOST|nr:hypothetical protein LSTR_LSTR008340 [Laodelphax striatellus]
MSGRTTGKVTNTAKLVKVDLVEISLTARVCSLSTCTLSHARIQQHTHVPACVCKKALVIRLLVCIVYAVNLPPPSLACDNIRADNLRMPPIYRADACLRCQAESMQDSRYGRQDCVVVWGECNHSFHYCCMSLWVKQNNRCPLCQQEWSIQRMGK